MAERRGRRVLIALAVVLIVLIGLFIAADRVAVYAAEATLAKQAKQELSNENIDVSGTPKVSIGGFPFLTQVARGHYEKITIVAAKPTTSGITVDDLVVVATGVTADTGALLNGSGAVTADRVTGTALVNWDTVNQLIDLSDFGGGAATVGPMSDGRVRITAPITIAGTSATATATGRLRISGSTVQVKIEEVHFTDGDVPQSIRQLAGTLERRLAFTIRIPALPYNLKLTGVSAQTDGVTLTATATNVPISHGG